MDVSQLIAIEEIKRLKYRYMRCIDLKLWDEIAGCFTHDATVSYDNGRWTADGRHEIISMLSQGLGPEVLSAHTVHHPEIDFAGAANATGTWALEDYVFNRRLNTTLHGGAYYTDEYVKRDGGWLISHTGYTRTFEHRTGIEPRWTGDHT